MKSLFCIMLLCLSIQVSAQSVIDASFTWNNKLVFFIKGDKVVQFNPVDNKVVKVTSLSQNALPGVPFKKIDAALNYGNGKIMLFSGHQYVRFDMTSFRADAGYPKTTTQMWTGVNFPKIDAALNWPNRAYLFSEDLYTRFNRAVNRQDEGYPKMTSSQLWAGLPFKHIDAGLTVNGKCYFFKGYQYVRYDVATDKTDAGYPKSISNWKGLMEALEGNVKPIPVAPTNNITPVSDISYTNKQFTVKKQVLDISPYKIKSPNKVVAEHKAVIADGIIYLSFQQEHDIIIMKYNQSYQKIGQPIVIRGHWLSDFCPMKNGDLVVLAGKSINNTYLGNYPNTLYFKKYSSQGQLLVNKYLFGGKGHEGGKQWFDGRSKGRIAFNGSEFGIYFEVQKNFAKTPSGKDIHNGDGFIVTDTEGNMKNDRYHEWTASHSNTLQVIAGADRQFYTMTIGDGSPYGLQVYNRDLRKNFVPYPPKEDYVPYSKVNCSNAAGLLRFMDEINNDELIAILGSTEHPNIGVFTKVDPLFLKISKSGKKVVKKKWLHITPDKQDSHISVRKMGKNYLLAWGGGNEYKNNWKAGNFNMSIINSNGDFILHPTTVAYPFCSSSELLPLSPSQFIWLEQTKNHSTSIDLYTVTFEGVR